MHFGVLFVICYYSASKNKSHDNDDTLHDHNLVQFEILTILSNGEKREPSILGQ